MTGALWNGLRGRACSVFSGDLQMSINEGATYFYADVVVKCGQSRDIILLVEVLSKSTEKYDRNVKFREYQKINWLREYLLVSQREPRIETWLRQPDADWSQSLFCGMDAVARLESVDCTVRLADIYEGMPAE